MCDVAGVTDILPTQVHVIMGVASGDSGGALQVGVWGALSPENFLKDSIFKCKTQTILAWQLLVA